MHRLATGLLLSAICDFMICAEEGSYGYTDSQQGMIPSTAEERFFQERFVPALRAIGIDSPPPPREFWPVHNAMS